MRNEPRGTHRGLEAQPVAALKQPAAAQTQPVATQKQAVAALKKPVTAQKQPFAPRQSSTWVRRISIAVAVLSIVYVGLTAALMAVHRPLPVPVESDRYQAFTLPDSYADLPLLEARSWDGVLVLTASQAWFNLQASAREDLVGRLSQLLVSGEGLARLIIIDPDGRLLAHANPERHEILAVGR